MLRTIPGLEVTDIPEADICCGSAGIYNMVQPDAGAELGRRKIANVISVAPDAVATGNPGCLLQMQRYLPESVPMFHTVELVDASIRGVDPIQASERRATESYDGRPRNRAGSDPSASGRRCRCVWSWRRTSSSAASPR